MLRSNFRTKASVLVLATCLSVLAAATSCDQTRNTPPSLSITPTTATLTAGDSALTFKAALEHASGEVKWALEPALGSLSAPTGLEVAYTPPASVAARTEVKLMASVGNLSATAIVTLEPRSGGPSAVFVDPVAGVDSADGTEDAPVKTLRHALTLAEGGKTVYLAGGTYDETSGETFSDETDGKFGYLIPDGVQITPDRRKTGAPVLLKSSAGGYALRFAGSGRISNMRLEGFREAISATAGTQSLSGINMKGIGEHGIALKGTADLTCTSCNISVDEYYALYLEESAKLKLDETSYINTESPAGAAYINVIYLANGSQAQAVLDLSGGSTVGGYQVFGGSLALTKVNLRLRNRNGDAIQVGPGAELSTTDGRISGGYFESAGSNEQALISSGTLTINGTVFENNLGGAIELQGGSATIQNATFQDIGDPNVVYAGFGLNAITVSKATKLRMRTTTITNIKAAFSTSPPTPGKAGVGVYVADASAGIDLGTESSLGRNILHDCGSWCLQVSGQGSAAGTVQAAGNTWKANAQSADASGNYAKQTVAPASTTYGDNYYVNYPNVLEF